MTRIKRKAPCGSAQSGRPCLSNVFDPTRGKSLRIGAIIYQNLDQIDFTGPFQILVRVPQSTVHVLGMKAGPVRDHMGLILTPEMTLEQSPDLDVLLVPGGPGQQALMNEEPMLSFIRDHVNAGKVLFSVCTGALICGAAGVLRGRRVTTHWSALDLLHYFGGVPVNERVVIGGNIVSAAGVTAGLDGALVLTSLLRGEEVAQRLQLEIQYAPEPPFQAGVPETAPPEVLAAVKAGSRALYEARLATAREAAVALGVPLV
jgi:cyclohexyl-isocyanide hydratase